MEFFLFAGLMALDMLLFLFLAIRYTYVESKQDEHDEKKREAEQSSESTPKKMQPNKQQNGTDNSAFTDDTSM